LRKEVRDDGAIETARAVDDVSGLFDGSDGVRSSGNLRFKPGFFDDVFGHRLTI